MTFCLSVPLVALCSSSSSTWQWCCRRSTYTLILTHCYLPLRRVHCFIGANKFILLFLVYCFPFVVLSIRIRTNNTSTHSNTPSCLSSVTDHTRSVCDNFRRIIRIKLNSTSENKNDKNTQLQPSSCEMLLFIYFSSTKNILRTEFSHTRMACNSGLACRQ